MSQRNTLFVVTWILKWIKKTSLQFIFLLCQAYTWYELGHKRGHFASVWQRSLYNVKGLKAQPWWTPRETGYTELVKVSVNLAFILTKPLSVSSSKSGRRQILYPVTLARSLVEMKMKGIFLKEQFSLILAKVLLHTPRNYCTPPGVCVGVQGFVWVCRLYLSIELLEIETEEM